MMATFAELLGYSLPDNAAEDSINILPAILAKDAQKIQRPALIADTGGHVLEQGNFSIRKGKWKLIEFNSRPPNSKRKAKYELYNMDKDPYERNDLSEVNTEIHEEIIHLLQDCKQNGLRQFNM